MTRHTWRPLGTCSARPVLGLGLGNVYLTTHSTHFMNGYMASDIWFRTILVVRKDTRCRHIGYSFRLTARVILYAPSHRQDSTYNGLCYTSRGALAGTPSPNPALHTDDENKQPRFPIQQELDALIPGLGLTKFNFRACNNETFVVEHFGQQLSNYSC